MDEFTDIYRIYAKNYLDTSFEEGWSKEDIELLKRKLDAVGSLIKNGAIIIGVLKREINDNLDCTSFNITLEHVVLALFDIECHVAKVQEPIKKEDETEVKPETSNRVSSSAPFKETLHKYGNATIYKEVYDHLLETIPNKFNHKNIFDLIDKFYIEKTKRELSHKTLQTYTGRYIEYMMMNEKIKIDQNSGMYVKTSQEQIIETPEKIDIIKPNDVWMENEDEIIKKYYPVMTAKKIKMEKLPNRSEQAIYDRAYFLKIQKLKHEKEPEKQNSQHLEEEWTGILPKKQVLKKYDTVYIYKPVVDEIMNDEKLPNEFIRRDLAKFLFNYYNHVLKRKITMGSADVYKSKYMLYLLENNLVKEKVIDGGPNKFIKIKDEDLKEEPEAEVTGNEITMDASKVEKPEIAIEEPIVEKSIITIKGIDDVDKTKKPTHADNKVKQPIDLDGDTLDESIYDYAIFTGWINASSLPVLTIERRFPDSTSDEIGIALAKLIQEDKAHQAGPGRIKFLRVND